jgi:hypothetical protein
MTDDLDVHVHVLCENKEHKNSVLVPVLAGVAGAWVVRKRKSTGPVPAALLTTC